tara:strand:+ start:1717 stop:2082 length:366 start_codon:yes stop_codon:yes gene_type:complete
MDKMDCFDNKKVNVLMTEVSIIKKIYNDNGKIMCRKCRKCKDPIKKGKLKDFNSTSKEQYMSGICSDKCWDECSEDEIMLFKFIAPLYLHKDCVIQRVNITHPTTYKCVEIDHNKNPIYKK